jgi:hypothetical protein
MKILKSLFRKWKNNDSQNHNLSSEISESNLIAEDLFLDNNPDLNAEQSSPEISTNPILEFKSRDFNRMGYRCGFEEHSSDALVNNIKRIKTEFRNIVSVIKDSKKADVFILKTELIEAQIISERLAKKIQLRIYEVESNINSLEYEIELSILDEGFVMDAIYSFKEGFDKGYNDFLEISHLGKETGLFN